MGSYNYYKMFGCFNRKFKISETEPPPDVVNAFRIYSEGEEEMSVDQFARFLVEYQREEGCTVADAGRIMQTVIQRRHHLTRNARQGFALDDFFYFLFQDDLNGPIPSQVHHDMTAPLQHYFIFTGHNSYLTGNQFSSDCSEIPIVKALERGVRGIELDLWPNSAKDNIHVLHGRTLTTPVPLFKCLKTIKDHAFVKSSYPVIITLEDHLTPELQAKVAEMITQVFGEMLYCPKSGHFEEFPSPEELKRQIIISTKPPKEYLEETKQNKEETASPKEKDSSEEESSLKETSECTTTTSPKPLSHFLGLETPESTTQSENDAMWESDQDDEDGDFQTQKACQLAPLQYKRLIAIHAGKPKHGVRHALLPGREKVKRLSLNEQELERAVSNYASDVVRFTQRNILRVFPKGTRVTSSNFHPLIGWMHGAQMLAFNMQGYGKSLWLMHGMFRANGGCGYVKKPDFLMKKGSKKELFNPKVTLPIKKTLLVSVYLGDGWRLDFSHTHFDAYSPPDFYTKLFIVGVPADEAKKKTRIIEDDWGPIWDEKFTFPLTVPELALLRIEIREHDNAEKDDFGGQTCLPVSELKPGIRSVPIYDRKGEKLRSVRLLMQFQFI